jgi:hypothetical protein
MADADGSRPNLGSPVAPRGRGRPRGSKNKNNTTPAAAGSSSAAPVKRRPGRPPGSKNKPKVTGAAPGPSAPPPAADVDMTISDTTKITTREYIYQVNSSTNIRIYYFIIQIKDTTLYFILYRFTEDLYTPRVKMRVQIKIISHECIRTLLAVHDFPSIKMHACSCTSHFKKTRETSVCLMYIKKRREAKIGPCYTKLHVNGQWSRTRPKALLVHRSRSRALDRLEAKRYRNLIERRRVRFC